MRIFISLIVLFSATAAASNKLTLVTEPFPPYFSPGLDKQGWLASTIQVSINNINMNNDLKFVNWARAQLLAKRDKGTILLGAYWRKDRAEHFFYSKPIAYVHTGLFSLKNTSNSQMTSLDKLRGYSIGVGRGYSVTPDFDVADYLEKHEFVDLRSALKLLSINKLDFVAGTKEIGMHWIRTAKPDEKLKHIVYLEPSLSRQSLHMVMSKSSPQNKLLLEQIHASFLSYIKSNSFADRMIAFGWKPREIEKYKSEISNQ